MDWLRLVLCGALTWAATVVAAVGVYVALYRALGPRGPFNKAADFAFMAGGAATLLLLVFVGGVLTIVVMSAK